MEKSGKVFVKGTFVNHPKLVVAKDCPRTETWFPDDWAKALKGADFGTPAGTVVKRFTKIVRQDKSVVVYSTSWRGTVEVFHQENPEWYHVICSNTNVRQYMADRESPRPSGRRVTFEVYDATHLADNILRGMINAGFF